jgi:BA14K-like protein
MRPLQVISVALFSLVMIGPLHAQGVIGPGGPNGLEPSAHGPDVGVIVPEPFRDVRDSDAYAMAPERESYCAQRYRSYDPQSGTFIGRDGRRYPCR